MVDGWIDSFEESRLFISVIAVGEVKKEVARLPESRRKSVLETWFEEEWLGRFKDRILMLDVDTMISSGNLTARLGLEGRPLPSIDSLIAATALQNDFVLVTRKVKDFAGVGLNILNPWAKNSQ